MDVVDKNTRSRMMANIHSKNTKPEMIIRKYLFKEGFRYRIHYRQLPGKPDIVLKKYKAVIFIHGCFWHRHDCKYFKWPKSRETFWRDKLNKNASNDITNILKLKDLKWRVCVIWECALRESRDNYETIIKTLVNWLKSSNSDFLEVKS